MASKSKRRGRVFRASCILAALIIAGSSFAWFTSKDEVTNRLTASSDYGVSIVESFTPPKMWVPGQEINKDVYAVNTGSIAAFVKENVSGILNYTFETKVGEWDEKCLVLNDTAKTSIDGVTTNEAGGFLAWTDATTTALSFDGKTAVKEGTKAGTIVKENTTVKDASNNDVTYAYKYVKDGKTYVGNNAAKDGVFYLVTNGAVNESTAEKLTLTEAEIPVALGEIASARETETDAPTRWAPTEEGTYIFRRSINHGAEGDDLHPDDDTFTYAGYYYVPNQIPDDPEDPNSATHASTTPGDGKFYKIVLGKDPYRAIVTTDPETGRKDYQFDIFADQADMNGVNDTTLTFNRDGTIEGTPKVWFVKEKNTEDLQVSFKYEEAVTTGTEAEKHNPRLVVEYSTAIANDPSTTTAGYDVIADRARAQVDYINRKGQYDQDMAEYEQAVADYTYAKKLSDAREALRKAAQDVYDKNAAANGTGGTQETLNTAWDALKDAAHTDPDSLAEALKALNITDTKTGDKWNNATTADMSPDELLKAAKGTGSTKSVYDVLTADQQTTPTAGPHLLNDVQADYEEMQTIWAAIQEDIVDINAALADYKDPMITPEKAVELKNKVNTKLDSLERNLGLYKDAYADLIGTFTSATDHTASELDLEDSATTGVKASIQALKDALAAAGTVGTKETNFNEKVQEFVNAYNADEEADAELAEYETKWAEAKAQYDKDVAAAQKEYEDAITKNAPKPQPDTYVDYSDNSADIVANYSATRVKQTLSATDTDGDGIKDNENPKHTGQVVADPRLVEFNATNFNKGTNAGQFEHDYDYYKTLVKDTADVALPKTGSSKVYDIPDGELADVNTNETWNEATKDDTAGANPTIKTLYDDIYKAGGSKELYNAATTAYETAQAAADANSNIKIYVNLDKDYADYWQYAGDMDPTGTTATKNAEFYYKYILEPGETSHRLIDSVELADTVTANDYKNLTFDLDVTLDSAQITYADDQRTITTEAVDANAAAFKLEVDEADKPLAFDQAFDWVARNAETSNIYKVDGAVITLNNTGKDVGAVGSETHYTYWFEDDSHNIYVSNSDSGTFGKVEGDTVSTTNTKTVMKS